MIEILNPQNKLDYKMPTKVYFGRGAIDVLSKIIKESPSSKFILVAGSHFYGSEDYKKIEKVDVYPRKIKKSTFEEINALVKYLQDGKYDGVIAIGGGVIMDCAKIAAAVAVNGGIAEDYLVSNTRKIESKGFFYIAVPTTSGTGSEVVPWGVVWGDMKYSLSSPEYMFPDVAIVDPALTDTCPKYITATSGIDALCQAIECYWNNNHNSVSDTHALKSIETILESLERAVNNPNEDVRNKMAWGSLKGGLAFSNTGTTICHAVSYPMTIHWGVAHGQATSITLPMFIENIFPIIPEERKRNILKAMGVKESKQASEKVKKLIEKIGLKTKLSELGILKEDIDIIVREGFDPIRMKSSPKIPLPTQLSEMLLGIL